ncbi:MAG: hypothetical protein Q8N18_18555 [Opitutaceae bacterium]|nr:hypothetical protein [Opitutaceae bacterium]
MAQEPTFKLTVTEKKILAQVDFDLTQTGSEALPSLTAACQLTKSLLDRKAIPEPRIRYFFDPEFNLGKNYSRKDQFERRGNQGDAIYTHPHFLKYLRYFLFGPDLPPTAIGAFAQRVTESGGFVSDSDYPDLNQIVRQAIKTYGLDPAAAAEEFFKLALECGLDPSTARRFRDTAKKIHK